MSKLADLIWKNAELLRGAYKENEYRKVILPFTILRRLDCVLQPTREAVMARYEAVRDKGYDLDKMLTPVSGYPFFNTSKFTLPNIAETPDDVRDNLEAMINGFSQNVRDIFEKFGFTATLDKLAEKNRLYLVAQRFAETDLDPQKVTNHDMGQAFEELLRKFNDVSPAGEQYTPRDVIELMVTLLFNGDDDILSVPGVVRTMYDPTAGTGGILSVAEEHLRKFNDRATLKLFGQELEDETYAICKADMLIRGQDPANIENGDTLEIDKHFSKTFEYQAANPPYGVEWKPAEDAVKKEHAKGAAGRFGPGLPAIRDGQMLFSLHLLSKMQPVVAGKGGGRIGVVHNGSPLFTGDAGSGESEIRRHILEHDYLDCIVALPTDMFYNTKVFDRDHFFYRRVTIERPLRMRFQSGEQGLKHLGYDTAFGKLPQEQKDLLTQTIQGMDAQASYMDDFAFKLEQAGDDKAVKSGKAKAKLFRYAQLHPTSIAQKVTVIVEHFREHVMHLLGGQAKAMVVSDSRVAAVRYKKAFDDYIRKMKYTDCKALVAYSGDVTDDESKVLKAKEGDLNDHKEHDDDIKEAFKTDTYQVLIVASKFQTGFDQPKLCAMYVDKRLDNVLAVQTLSRLNRTYPGKETPFVLDFRNEAEDILKAFLPFYRTAKMSAVTDPNLVHTLRQKLDDAGIYLWEEVLQFAKGYFDPKGKQATIQSPLKKAHERFTAQPKEVQDLFRGDVSSFISAYDFLSQLRSYDDADLERLHAFCRMLLPRLQGKAGGDEALDESVRLAGYKVVMPCAKGRLCE